MGNAGSWHVDWVMMRCVNDDGDGDLSTVCLVSCLRVLFKIGSDSNRLWRK
jgi:hypothetical protein